MFPIYFAALIPFYDTYGQNSTYVLFKDRSHDSFNVPIKAYLNRMLYQLHLDPKAIQFWTSQIIGAKLNTPLIIDETLVFLPVKFRHAIGKQDGCFGYVSESCIEKFEDNKLILNNGEILNTLSSKNYIQKKQKDAALLSYAYTDYKKHYEFMWKN